MTATEFQIASAIQPLTRAGSIYAWRSGVDSNPRRREGFYGRNSAPVWRTIRPDKKHLCRREFVRLRFGSAPALSDSLLGWTGNA